ncbi:SIS domain-containing protein [Patescibacteria group bacterium]|nr:SIS domain-containing protein [Patescibacteria group bacterium]
MTNPDDLAQIKKLDPQNTYSSTQLFAAQCKAAWEEVKKIEISNMSDIENIVCCGMGASIYGALVTQALIGENLRYPFQNISDYHLPKFVNNKTLVILTSYSGNTEEVLSCAQEAKEKNAKMLVLTKGGKLEDFAKENKIPSYIFDGKLNPAGVPRLGNGYSVVGLLGLLNKAGIIEIKENIITQAFEKIIKNKDEIQQKAKLSSRNFINKIPIIFAAEHLSGNAQILRNQFNETSKTFSAFYLVPDLNHHLLEGLQFPTESNLIFFSLDSINYSTKIKKRMELTKDVTSQNNREIIEYRANGENKYEDILEVMNFGSWLTFYLGIIYNQNPAINPWVDYFKEELAK